jgi:protein-tyrosine phosphatase
MSIPPFRLLPVPFGALGKVYLHSMPGRYESWGNFVDTATATQISDIVCLTPDCEITEKSPAYEEALQKKLPYTIHCFPIPDFDVPEDQEKFSLFISSVAKFIHEGRHILIHCGAGVGRTGMVASCLLLALGCSIDEARDAVTSAGSDPETPEQRRLVQSISSQITR